MWLTFFGDIITKKCKSASHDCSAGEKGVTIFIGHEAERGSAKQPRHVWFRGAAGRPGGWSGTTLERGRSLGGAQWGEALTLRQRAGYAWLWWPVCPTHTLMVAVNNYLLES